jgi:uncharacterized RDD family membrane protein YckC
MNPFLDDSPAMDEHNPYTAPEAPIVDVSLVADNTLPLAGRFERWVASILDSIVMLPFIVPLFYFDITASVIENDGSLTSTIATELFSSILAFALFALLQAYPLHKYGQTWGKMPFGIRIVDLEGRKPNFWRILALRYLPWYLMPTLSINLFFVIVDSLMIFRADRRCAHDLIAGTRVVVRQDHL